MCVYCVVHTVIRTVCYELCIYLNMVSEHPCSAMPSVCVPASSCWIELPDVQYTARLFLFRAY
jgi:hypothetical protein